MARSTSIQAVLDRVPLTRGIKADAWDAFHAASSPADLVGLLNRLPLPSHVKAELWDLKAQEKDGNMLPREMKMGRYGDTLPDKRPRPPLSDPEPEPDQEPRKPGRSGITAFVNEHYKHFNAGVLQRAAEAYVAHLAKGGQMFLSMAGAASTGELGRVLAPMIREGKISGLSVTGANLEEDLFLLVGKDAYRAKPDYHQHTPEHDRALGEAGHPRVTDVTIPEEAAMRPVEQVLMTHWAALESSGERKFPHELLYDVIRRHELADAYEGDVANSWLVAAAETKLPLFVPGWEDSTLGNVFAAQCYLGTFQPSLMKSGIEYMVELTKWYRKTSQQHDLGFFQLGGGIAGDFSICVVPLLIADVKEEDTKPWTYFCQITDADESYGGYSGALPTEKASWLKIPASAPAFNIKSDYSIAFPLIAAIVLGR